MKKINLYHFGDCGGFDDNNPFKVFSSKYVAEVLYMIASNEPYKYSMEDFEELLDIEKSIIEKMKCLKMIDEKDNKLSLNFTVIIEEDLCEIDKFSKKIAKKISNLINENKREIHDYIKGLYGYGKFSNEELLYHLIGCEILDGTAIDQLGAKGLICTEKKQVDDRSYVLFGFEKNESVDEISENILCSCNNYTVEDVSFMSFGDADGNRNDFYRYNRQVINQINKIENSSETNKTYIKILEKSNKDIGLKCANIIKRMLKGVGRLSDFTIEEREHFNLMESFGYVKNNSNIIEMNVPIFTKKDNEIVLKLDKLIMDLILPIIEVEFEGDLEISAIKHGVSKSEVFNEIWHQIFGNINENLVNEGLMKKPKFIKGEGRYLQAIYLR